MTEPIVAAICLVNGRNDMVRRAVRSFRAETYDAMRRHLILFDTGQTLFETDGSDAENEVRVDAREFQECRIGALRNAAGALTPGADIIVHWDSDDYSNPNRIAEQVELLQSNGADCVGYREVMFWDTRPGAFCGAWLYTNPCSNWCHGASLCYWRKSWERKKFEDMNAGEDLVWQAGLKRAAVSGVGHSKTCFGKRDAEPRLICGLHGGNTSAAIVAGAPEWKRAPLWDERVRAIMEA